MTYGSWLTPLLSIAALGIGFYYFRVNRRRTQLRYTISTRPVFSLKTNGPFTFDGAEVADPYEVWISFTPRGIKDITSSDFDGGAGLHLDLEAPLVASMDTSASSLKVEGNRGDRQVIIAPQLLKCGGVIDARLIVDGPPTPQLHGGVTDADLVLSSASDDSSSRRGALWAAVSLVSAGAAVGVALTAGVLLYSFVKSDQQGRPSEQDIANLIVSAEVAQRERISQAVQQALAEADTRRELGQPPVGAVPPIRSDHQVSAGG